MDSRFLCASDSDIEALKQVSSSKNTNSMLAEDI